MNDLKIFFDECSLAVDETLDRLVPDEKVEPVKLHKAVRWSLFAGGKRFRPALLLATGDAFGAPRAKLLTAAAAIEMIHTYSLIHDDLPAMDDDDLRRGRQTCHKKFGEATAILAGDVLQTLAFQALAADENLTADVRVKLISELARAAGTPAGMVAGQQLDLDGEGGKTSLKNLEIIHRSKTGALILFAARAGAIVAKAKKSQLEAVSNYAANLGLLFQITDDLLDVTQTTETLGKTAGKDSAAEKATYPAFYGVADARKLAEKTCADALDALEKVDGDTRLLKDLADFILRREK